MIGAVSRRTVSVDIAVVPRQQAIQGRHEVHVGSRAELDDHHSRRGVGDEDVQQPVALAGYETGALGGQVE